MSLPLTPKRRPEPTASNRLDPQTLVESLEDLLSEMLSLYEQSLANTREHRAAVSQANRVAMARCASTQASLQAKIDAAERRRSSLLAAFRQGVSLREVLSALDGQDTERCEELGRSLKDVVSQLRREQKRLGLASSSLAQHMQGLMQQIQRSLSHAGVYSTQGRVEAGGVVMSALDVTS